LPLPLILQPSDFGPHIVTSLLLDTTSVPQPTEITQFIFGQPLTPISGFPGDTEIAERVNKLLPGYVTLVTLELASYKLKAETDEFLASLEEKNASEALVRAQQILFGAVGAYILHAYECGKDPVFFYSPIGTDHGWMFNRPLYAYYHIVPKVVPALLPPPLLFEQYQTLPVADTALRFLETIASAAPAIVLAHDAYIFNFYADPNDARSKPSWASCALGSMAKVRR
jgi:hypothetical protein